MPLSSPSARLRAQLRERIIERIDDLELSRREAGEVMGLNKAQMCRLMADEDVFSLDRLTDAAGALYLVVRMTVTRPWGMQR